MSTSDPSRRETAAPARGNTLACRILGTVLVGLSAIEHGAAQCNLSPELQMKLKMSPTAETYAGIGQRFADLKMFDCAAESFASASKLQPQSAPLAYLWGLSLYTAGKDEAALLPLHTSARLNPGDIRSHLVTAAAMDRLKRIPEAEAEWRLALAIDPDSATALDSLSVDLIDLKDYASVIALLEKPGSDRARTSLQSLNLGIAYGGRAELDEAAKVLREGLDNDPDSLAIADELAVVLMLHGHDQDAFAVLNLALAKRPNDQPTQLLYLRTMVSSHSDKAQDYGHKLLEAYPDDWEVQYLNGVLESREADFQTARSHLERSIALNPGEYRPHDALGNVLARLDDLPGARTELETAIALGDDQPEVQYDLAMVLKRLGDKAGAQQRLEIYQKLRGARSDKEQAAGKAEEAEQAMSAGQSAKAVSLYREATTILPDEPLLHYKLALALDKMQDTAGETAELDRTIQLNPNLAEAQNQRGFIAVRSGDARQAESCFRAAIRISPSFTAAWINLAATLASETRWQEARQAVNHALEIDPENAQARQLDQALSEAHPGP
jgi:Flp pilus assembly protein TadD